jgi:hypothetical protein
MRTAALGRAGEPRLARKLRTRTAEGGCPMLDEQCPPVPPQQGDRKVASQLPSLAQHLHTTNFGCTARAVHSLALRIPASG